MHLYAIVGLSATLSFGASNTAWGNAITSNFDTGNDGWGVTTFYGPLDSNPPTQAGSFPVTYNASGGNPGGFISSGDPDHHIWYFDAPAKFLGDQSSVFGYTLSFDAKDLGGNPNFTSELILTGAGSTLYYFASLNPSTSWTHFEIPLAPDGSWHLNSQDGPTPTGTQFQAVLGSLDGMYVFGDWIEYGDNSGLDNVVLAPEPTTALLLASGLTALAVRRRRKMR